MVLLGEAQKEKVPIVQILVFGRSGQVARSLQALADDDSGLGVAARGRESCDIADADAVRRAIDATRPDAIVNAAAYTAVDRAESEEIAAYTANALGARNIAEAARAAGLPLVHLSTDYVFDGRLDRPYREDDLPFPTSAYGRTKLAGEYVVRHAAPDSAVLRTAWVFSPYNGNFARTMLRLAAERASLRVVDDQVGNPTYAPDIARATVTVARALQAQAGAGCRGVFHFAGPEPMSWCAFARRVMATAGRHGRPTARVEPIATSDYPTVATRPANSRLDTGAFRKAFGIPHRPLDECLEDMMAALARQG